MSIDGPFPVHARQDRGRSLSALAADVISGLEQYRSVNGAPPLGDAELRHIASAVRIEAYDPALNALRRAIDGLEDRTDPLPPGQIALRRGALLDLHWLLHEIEERRFDRTLTLLAAVRDSLQRLRAPETTRQMLDLATAEAAASCGLTRIVMFKVQGNVLDVRGVRWTDDSDLLEEWSAIARANPPMLDPRDRETRMLRRHDPIIVTPDVAVGMKLVTDASRTVAYAAAPIVLGGSVVGTIHGDRHLTNQSVDTVNRDLLATFADGVSGILERTAHLDRMRGQYRRLRKLLAQSESTLEELMYTGTELILDGHGDVESAAHPAHTAAHGDSRLLALLTPRELQVIELLAAGAHNADIATRLVISETTVKSHVKQILRKMQASNRAEAASRYVRLKSMPQL